MADKPSASQQERGVNPEENKPVALQLNPGNALVIIAQLLEMINKNICALLRETREQNGRLNKPTE